jgi:Na+-transporting NADH:ubiquinone oxidoreductase subunit F
LGLITTGCVVAGSLLPAVLIGLPAFYGAWLVVFFGATQHAGLAQNVLDHRLSTRTVRMNPLFRFLYLNMNHHLEHHLYPTVPYHQLPALQQLLAPHLPAPLPSTWAAYRQILPTLWAQRRDVTCEIEPVLPSEEATQAATTTQRIEAQRIEPQRIEPQRIEEVNSASLQIGAMCLVATDDGEKLLCRVNQDDWVLTDALCTHGDARLVEGVLNDWTLECPRHNGRFDLRDGRALRRPATVGLSVTRLSVPEAAPQS